MKKHIVALFALVSLVAAGCNQAIDTATPTVSTPKEAVVPQQAPAQGSAPSVTGYTLAEVKTHSKQTDCWLAVDGLVYDVTKFIPRHPGGPARIIPLCGTDATSSFENQHSGEPKPAAMLASFKIGVLQ